MRNHLAMYVERLLHALAEAGYQPPAQDLQLLVGPTGAVMWTETTRVPGDPPSSTDAWTTKADTLPALIETRPKVAIRRPELMGM
jgi:hypothetical protein